MSGDRLFGVLGEFRADEPLVEAARTVRAAGWRRVEAFTPHHVEGLADALGHRPTRLPLAVFAGGVLGGAFGYAMQWYSAAVDYPLDVGGRAPHSAPAFMPVTFELAVLGAALTAVLGMLAASGLPRPHHPLFGLPRFALATRDRLFLCILADDPRFEPEEAERALIAAGASLVQQVPA